MKTLPRVIVAPDGSLREVGRYELVAPRTGVLSNLMERDYDELILRHAEALASVLRKAS